MKNCSKCFIELELSSFWKNSKGYYSSYCKPCSVATAKAWRVANASKYKVSRNKHWSRVKDVENKKRRLNRSEKERDYSREYSKIRMSNPHEKLAHRIRNRVRDAVRGRRPASSIESLGVSISEFKLFIENQFYPRHDGLEMSWDNAKLWHLDHVIPLSKFDLNNPMEFREACDWLNYQPLWAIENIIKSNK